MGFEKMNQYEIHCDCGKGTFQIFTEMDDWNRIKNHSTIHCEECRKEEKLKERKINEERNRLNNLREEITKYFDQNYMEQWQRVFKNYKNKKEIYIFLKEKSIIDCNLNSFYNKFTGKSNEEIIAGITNFKNIEIILNVINILDIHLTTLSIEAIELEKKESNRTMAAYHKGV
ncbi:MAG: hypothetical protein WAX04_11720 [Oscillospiraceae bacterium]